MNRKEEIEVLQRHIAESISSLALAYASTLDMAALNSLIIHVEYLRKYVKEIEQDKDWPR